MTNLPPKFTGPGSPQDVPPQPGELGVDPYNLPAPVREDLLKPDPVAPDAIAKELKDGANQCPQCGGTDFRQKPGTDLLVCAFCRHEWQAARVEEEFGLGVGQDKLEGTIIASGARDIAADEAV